MFLVTGGAGFIGSNVVAALNDAGRADVVVCDFLGSDGKWRNLAKRQLADVVPPADLSAWLDGRKLDAIIHMGAISETTATDGDLVIETNFRLSTRLFDWCTANATPFIYASSAATYGDGDQGFVDDPSLDALKKLRPMNLYGWSKQLFDLSAGGAHQAGRKNAAAMGRAEILQRVRSQRISQGRDDERAGEAVRRHPLRQERAAVQVAPGRHCRRRPAARLHLCRRRGARSCGYWRRGSVTGIFNVGTGKARSFRELIVAAYDALGAQPEHPLCRHAAANSRQLSVFHASLRRSAASRRLQWRLYFA